MVATYTNALRLFSGCAQTAPLANQNLCVYACVMSEFITYGMVKNIKITNYWYGSPQKQHLNAPIIGTAHTTIWY
jgi:uncharacterized protein (DUF1015 family)